jgi:predicted transcriptional regulator
METRAYQKKKSIVQKYIRKSGAVDHSRILNEVDVDYDTLMRILAELQREGKIK